MPERVARRNRDRVHKRRRVGRVAPRIWGLETPKFVVDLVLGWGVGMVGTTCR